jgi:hypothetical protein
VALPGELYLFLDLSRCEEVRTKRVVTDQRRLGWILLQHAVRGEQV